MKKSESCLLFMHVPKAAGTTLHSIINKQYNKDTVLDIRAGQSFKEAFLTIENIPREKRDKLLVIKGHMPFGLHKYLNKPFTYITFLRQPVKRIISNYFYLVNNPGHALYEKVVNENKMSLQQYAESYLTYEVDNYQTRMFSGLNTDRFLYDNKEFPKCTDHDLTTAKKNLDEYFSLVGLTDYFDESLLLLKKYFNWDNIYYFKRKETNYKNVKSDISKECISIIEKRNNLDIELYDYAEIKFKKLLQSQDNEFYDQLNKYKKNNYIYGQIMKFPYKMYTFVRRK